MPKLRVTAAELSAGIFAGAVDNIAKAAGEASSLIVNSESTFAKSINSSISSMWTTPSEGIATSTIDVFAQGMIEGLKPTGVALCALFFIIGLVELAMSERMTLEYMVKYFSKLVIGYAAVYFSDDIYLKVRELGAALTAFINKDNDPGNLVDQYTGQIADSFINFVERPGAGSGDWLPLLLGSMLIGGFIYLVSFALIAVIYINVFTWALELGVRGCFLPIACALLSDDGWRGAGGRYLKRFLGVASQGMVMIAVMNLTENVIVSAANSFSAEIEDTATVMGIIGPTAMTAVIILAIGFAGVGVMMKSMSIVSDIFGA